MTGAIFCESRPATIMRSAWRGDGRKTSAPKRATSKRAAAMDIISMAQQARPNPRGQMELLRAQFTALSSVVKIMPSSSSSLPKSSGRVSVTCLPRVVLMWPQFYFGTDRAARQTQSREAQVVAVALGPASTHAFPFLSRKHNSPPPHKPLRVVELRAAEGFELRVDRTAKKAAKPSS